MFDERFFVHFNGEESDQSFTLPQSVLFHTSVLQIQMLKYDV